MSFVVSESGKKGEVVKKLREGYGPPMDPTATEIAKILADRLDRTVPDSVHPVTVHVSGHIQVHPKHYG